MKRSPRRSRDWPAMVKSLMRSMTQGEIARALGVSQAFVSQIASGACRLRDVDVALDLLDLYDRQALKSPPRRAGQAQRDIRGAA